jgi:hypothetical protein
MSWYRVPLWDLWPDITSCHCDISLPWVLTGGWLISSFPRYFSMMCWSRTQSYTAWNDNPFAIYIYSYILAYFPGVARVFIYPNLIVICVPSLAEIAHLGGIFLIITSTLLGGTLPTRRLIYILLHLRTNYSVEYPTVNSFTFHVTR